MKCRYWLLASTLPLLACGSSDAERDPYAHPPSAPPPHATVDNAAPLGNVSEAKREEAVDEKPAAGAIEANFKALGRSERALQAKAALTQVADGVRVHLQVEHGRPGRARLLVERGPCRTRAVPSIRAPSPLERRGATPADLTSPASGEIEIHDNGQADYTTTLSEATLEPGTPHSLAGKALVVYQARELDGKLRTSEVPVACAEVPKPH
jgi:hypothetical protein